jgi:hypothetical protein
MELNGTTVTIPLSLFNEMAACYYGRGPSKYETKRQRDFAMGVPQGVTQLPLDGETETNHVRETLSKAVIEQIGGLPGRRGFEPAGILKKRLEEAKAPKEKATS